MEKITFVIPIYNVEEFLPQCLDSVLYQTRRDHKAILVDDGSKDSSGAIADAYAKEHPEIFTVIHQANGGPSVARNRALKQVETSYVTFLDGDDFLTLDFVEVFEKRLRLFDEPPEVVLTLPIVYDQCRGVTFDFKDAALLRELFPTEVTVLNTRIERRLYDLEVSPCRRVIRMDLVRSMGFSFPEGTRWEDVLPHFQLMRRATSVTAIPAIGFFYRIGREAQMTSNGGKERLQVPTVFGVVFRNARDQHWPDPDAAHILRFALIFVSWSLDVIAPEYRGEFLDAVHRLFKDLPKGLIAAYMAECFPVRRDRVLIRVFRSRFLCNLLKNDIAAHSLYASGRRIFHRIKRG